MANELRKIQNKIYKAVSDFCGKIHRDNAWQNVGRLADIIRSVEGVRDLSLGAGVYNNYINKSDPTSPAYRDYKITIITDFGNLSGYIRCHAAGSVEDEFDRYDMTVNIYPDRGDGLMEGKVRFSESDICGLVLESIKRMMKEQANPQELYKALSQYGSDAASLGSDVAEYLFKSNIDMTEFVHWVEKTHEMLVADKDDDNGTAQSAVMGNPTNDGSGDGGFIAEDLIEAIKKAKSFEDITQTFDGIEAGFAKLSKKVSVIAYDAQGNPVNIHIDGIAYGLVDYESYPMFYGCLTVNNKSSLYEIVDDYLGPDDIKKIIYLIQ